MPVGPESAVSCPKCARPQPSGSARTCAFCGTALRGLRRDQLLGHVVASRFRIEELVGQGGMGKVYRARHLSLERDVCIKMLKPALLEDPTLVGRFEREAKAASRLSHPNVIQVLDFGRTEDGGLYIAMEFVKGKDLRIVLRDEWPIDEKRLCKIIAQVLSALGEAHAHKIIHRDLKPENIMVEPRRGEPDFVKVLDFGIAKILDSELPGLTRSDVVCGTPQYMAPEQATGQSLDNRCDLYAVGVILYQLVTGQLPFDGPNSMDVLNKHVNDRPIPPRLRTPGAPISEAMERMILRALEKDPLARPQTAEAFRAMALEIAQPSPLAANYPQPTPPPPTLSPPVVEQRSAATPAASRSRWARLMMAIGGAGAIAASLVAARWLWPSEVAAPIRAATLMPARDPGRARELVSKAGDALSKEDANGANTLLLQALELDPNNADAHYRLAGLLMLEAKPERARAEYEAAKRLDAARYAKQVDSILGSL
jgi:serine/threonine-protein kinase